MSSGGGQADLSEGALLVFMVFLILLAIAFSFLSEHYIYIWYYIKYPIVKGLFYIPDMIRTYLFFWIELIPALRVPDLNFFITELNREFDEGLDYLVTQQDRGFFDIDHKSMIINYIILPFISVPLLLVVKKIGTIKTFNKSLSMSEFRVQEAERWPVIKPIIHLSSKVVNNIDEGPWAMSMRPEVFFSENDYLLFFDDEQREVKLNDKKNLKEFMSSYTMSIDADKVNDYFIEQLGEPWDGIEGLSIEEKHLLMVLLPKISRKGDETLEILDLFGNYYTSETGRKIKKEKKRLEKIINKRMNIVFSSYFDHPNVKVIIKKHHFKYTVFAALLNEARNDGTLSNGLFIWLKPLNRTLWFMMCSVGRKLPIPDAAGIWCHYLNEKALNTAITLPRIKSSVESVDQYFTDRYDNYVPFNELNKKE